MRLFFYILTATLFFTSACTASSLNTITVINEIDDSTQVELAEDVIDIKNGHFILYWSPEIIRAEGPVSNHQKDGEWKYYYNDSNDKTVKKVGVYRSGLKQGQWITYYRDGRIMKKESFRNDELNGAVFVYTPEGIPLSEVWYRNGKKHGVYREYYPDGKPKEISMYTDDKKNGTENLYYTTGK